MHQFKSFSTILVNVWSIYSSFFAKVVRRNHIHLFTVRVDFHVRQGARIQLDRQRCYHLSNWFTGNKNLLVQSYSYNHTPASTKVKGEYTGFTLSVHLSVRPSVRLWTESCPFCILHNTSRIHFKCTHLIKQLSICICECRWNLLAVVML